MGINSKFSSVLILSILPLLVVANLWVVRIIEFVFLRLIRVV